MQNLKFAYKYNSSVVVLNRATGILAIVNKTDKCLNYNKRTVNTFSGKTPVRTYFYPDKEKDMILAENKGQSGVYR